MFGLLWTAFGTQTALWTLAALLGLALGTALFQLVRLGRELRR